MEDIRNQENLVHEDLKQLPRCSVLFFSAHILYYRIQGRPVFSGLGTATKDTPENRTRYQHEIENGLISYQEEPEILWITKEFIQKYWRFEKNRFVFINGCYSFDEALMGIFLGPASDDPHVRSGCGASVYGGWTGGSTGGDDDNDICHLFDRLLGVNIMSDYPKEYPPQRSFNWEQVLVDMEGKNHTRAWDLDDKGWSLLQIAASGSGDFGLLAPSIAYLDMDDESKKLTLTGLFGSRQGEVHVGKNPKGADNCPVQIDSWSPATIECTIPNEGESASGRVTVHVNDIESNPRFLTEWRGDSVYECTWNEPAVSKNISGTLNLTVNTTHHFRADIADYRESPGTKPKYREMIYVHGADDSTCTWRVTGALCELEPFMRQKPLYTEHWEADRNVPVKRYGQFYMYVGLSPTTKTIPVEYDLQVKKAFQAKTGGQIRMSVESWRDVQLLIPPEWRNEVNPYPMAIYDENGKIPDLHMGPTVYAPPPPFLWIPEPPAFIPKCMITYQRNAIPAVENTVPEKDAAH